MITTNKGERKFALRKEKPPRNILPLFWRSKEWAKVRICPNGENVRKRSLEALQVRKHFVLSNVPLFEPLLRTSGAVGPTRHYDETHSGSDRNRPDVQVVRWPGFWKLLQVSVHSS